MNGPAGTGSGRRSRAAGPRCARELGELRQVGEVEGGGHSGLLDELDEAAQARLERIVDPVVGRELRVADLALGQTGDPHVGVGDRGERDAVVEEPDPGALGGAPAVPVAAVTVPVPPVGVA